MPFNIYFRVKRRDLPPRNANIIFPLSRTICEVLNYFNAAETINRSSVLVEKCSRFQKLSFRKFTMKQKEQEQICAYKQSTFSIWNLYMWNYPICRTNLDPPALWPSIFKKNRNLHLSLSGTIFGYSDFVANPKMYIPRCLVPRMFLLGHTFLVFHTQTIVF